MTINMLKAVSSMLTCPKEETPEAIFRAKVDCARIMLDQIILGLEKEPVETTTKSNAKVTVKEVPEGAEPIIIVDNGVVTGTKNFPEDGMVELDGVKMHHKDAIGKKVKSGKIL